MDTNKLRKQGLTVVLSDYEENFTANVISEIIKTKISDEYELKFRFSFYGHELLEFAETGAVDVFILNLNCLTNSDKTLHTACGLEYSLQILSVIKTKYPIPVIAFSAFSKIAARAKLAGADFYLDQPFKVEEFWRAFEKCLKILSGAAHRQSSDQMI